MLQDYRLLEGVAFDGAPCTPLFDIPLGRAQFELTFEVIVGADGGMAGRLVYNSDALAAETVAGLAAGFRAVCGAVAEDAGAALADLPLAEGGALGTAVVALSCAEARPDYLAAPLVHEAVAEHAKRGPGRPCLVFEGATLSYGEVDARAARLARTLRTLGVTRGSAVGILMERSFDLVIAMLAAMKAGGAYVPLDPDYPPDRLAGYCEDAGVAVLLTHRAHEGTAAEMAAASAAAASAAASGDAASAAPAALVASTLYVDEFWGEKEEGGGGGGGLLGMFRGGKQGQAAGEGAGREDPAYIEFTRWVGMGVGGRLPLGAFGCIGVSVCS